MDNQTDRENLLVEHQTILTLTGPDASPVPAMLTKPSIPTSTMVILCHGFLSDKDSRTNQRLTELLVPKGIATFRFDWYGMGELRESFPHLTIRRCLNQLTAIMSYAAGQGMTSLGLIGSSFGGFMALIAAAQFQAFHAIGLKCPVTDFSECLRVEFGENGLASWKDTNRIPNITLNGPETIPLDYGFFEECQQYDGYASAARVHAPTRIVHGEKDNVIPSHQIDRLLSALKGPKDLQLLPEADHQFGRPEDFRLMTNLLANWMVDHLSSSDTLSS